MRLKIALFTSGRFHLCDVARELLKLGHEVTLYSLVSPRRAREFGMPKSAVKWLGIHMIPTLIRLSLSRNRQVNRRLLQQVTLKLDAVAARQIKPCDVFIGMSGMSNLVARRAKRDFNAHIRIQRCSRHVLSQQSILSQIPTAEQVTGFDVDRELFDYTTADVIDVPAEHCVESFVEHGVSASRVFCNPFGVDLNCFMPTGTPGQPATFIMTGTWSLRKGCDVLLNAWRMLPGSRLLHVGPVGDFSLPTDENFIHIEPVKQSELPQYYAQAHAMCLASREEGLAFVQPQALACGLPLICTERTGGADLKPFVKDEGSITVVPPDDVYAFSRAMQNHLVQNNSNHLGPRTLLTDVGRAQFTWSAYTERLLSSIGSATVSSEV